MRSKPYTTEAEMAAQVVMWLDSQHWDVYQEVKLKHHSFIVDIVAVQHGRIWMVETKLSLGLALMAQAYKRMPYAHYTSVAAPPHCRGDEKYFIEHVLKETGIGLFEVHEENKTWANDNFGVKELIAPRINRRIVEGALGSLLPGQKTYARAGSAHGRCWTPFQQTCRAVRQYLVNHPGITLKELVDAVPTHYRNAKSAKGCLAAWIRKGILKGVYTEKHDKKMLLFPVKHFVEPNPE